MQLTKLIVRIALNIISSSVVAGNKQQLLIMACALTALHCGALVDY